MSVRKTVHTVEHLAHDAVTTAVSAARHPVGTAALTLGLVRGTVRAGRDLIRRDHASPAQQARFTDEPEAAGPGDIDDIDDRDLDLDLTDPDDLPEPVVIEAVPDLPADDEPLPESGEAFHTEPKAATRDSAHGDTGGDLEDAAGYVEEIPDPDEEVLWTSETPVADDGEPVLDEAIAHAVESEAAMMQKAADVTKE